MVAKVGQEKYEREARGGRLVLCCRRIAERIDRRALGVRFFRARMPILEQPVLKEAAGRVTSEILYSEIMEPGKQLLRGPGMISTIDACMGYTPFERREGSCFIVTRL